MAYTRKQAQRLAQQIFDRFRPQILAAATNLVTEEIIAGLIGVEAGKDRSGKFREDATRFEPHVFTGLKRLRSGNVEKYQGLVRREVADADDDALRALATSYGLLQVMGFHCVKLKCSVAELRDPITHLTYAVILMSKVAKPYLTAAANAKTKAAKDAAIEAIGRIWNSGSANGKTYDPDYTVNSRLVREAYSELLASTPKPTAVANPAIDSPSDLAKEPASSTSGTTSTSSPENSDDAPVEEPKPAGFLKKLSAAVASLLGGTILYDSLGKFSGISLSREAVFVICFLATLGFFGFIIWYVVDTWKQNERVKTVAATASDPNLRRIKFVKRSE